MHTKFSKWYLHWDSFRAIATTTNKKKMNTNGKRKKEPNWDKAYIGITLNESISNGCAVVVIMIAVVASLHFVHVEKTLYRLSWFNQQFETRDFVFMIIITLDSATVSNVSICTFDIRHLLFCIMFFKYMYACHFSCSNCWRCFSVYFFLFFCLYFLSPKFWTAITLATVCLTDAQQETNGCKTDCISEWNSQICATNDEGKTKVFPSECVMKSENCLNKSSKLDLQVFRFIFGPTKSTKLYVKIVLDFVDYRVRANWPSRRWFMSIKSLCMHSTWTYYRNTLNNAIQIFGETKQKEKTMKHFKLYICISNHLFF